MDGNEEVKEQGGMVCVRVGFLKLTNLCLKNPNPKTSKRGRSRWWERLEEVEYEQLEVEERLAELKNKDKLTKAMNKVSKDVDRISNEAIWVLKK
jgi:hypothetical protein